MDDRFGFLREIPRSRSRPIEQSFHNRTKGCQGEVAVQYWPPARGVRTPPEHIVVFILGLLNYYHPFLSHLHYLLPPSHAILSTSHIGHSPHLPAPETPLDLHQQLEAKVELLNSLARFLDSWSDEKTTPASRRAEPAESHVKPRVSLMGHSVGSWFLLELMKRLPEHTEAGYMLFPTLGWIADTWNGRTLWPIFHRPMKQILPYITYIFRPILHLITFPPTTLSLLRSPETVRHCLHLSRSEMDHILAPDLTTVRKLSNAKVPNGQGLYGIWAGGRLDGWVGREGQMVRDVMGEEGERVRVVDKIPHAFCLSRHHSHHIAEIVAAWIDPSSATDDGHSESDASLILTDVIM